MKYVKYVKRVAIFVCAFLLVVSYQMSLVAYQPDVLAIKFANKSSSEIPIHAFFMKKEAFVVQMEGLGWTEQAVGALLEISTKVEEMLPTFFSLTTVPKSPGTPSLPAIPPSTLIAGPTTPSTTTPSTTNTFNYNTLPTTTPSTTTPSTTTPSTTTPSTTTPSTTTTPPAQSAGTSTTSTSQSGTSAKPPSGQGTVAAAQAPTVKKPVTITDVRNVITLFNETTRSLGKLADRFGPAIASAVHEGDSDIFKLMYSRHSEKRYVRVSGDDRSKLCKFTTTTKVSSTCLNPPCVGILCPKNVVLVILGSKGQYGIADYKQILFQSSFDFSKYNSVVYGPQSGVAMFEHIDCETGKVDRAKKVYYPPAAGEEVMRQVEDDLLKKQQALIDRLEDEKRAVEEAQRKAEEEKSEPKKKTPEEIAEERFQAEEASLAEEAAIQEAMEKLRATRAAKKAVEKAATESAANVAAEAAAQPSQPTATPTTSGSDTSAGGSSLAGTPAVESSTPGDELVDRRSSDNDRFSGVPL